MKFNNRACALMDIPDLPAMAFQHIGDKKIKPQGGGGGGGLVSAITDPISSALGTDGGDGGILGGLADVDEFVNREIPGGWVLPAAVAAAYATGYIDPSLFASEAAATAGAEAGAGAIATEAGQTAFFDALASGATSADAVSAGLSADALASGAAPIFDYSQEVILSPGGNYIPANTLPSEIAALDAEILAAGQAAIKAAPSTISPLQAIQGLRMASGLLGGQQGIPSGAGAATQFRGSTMPEGTVDYSGILNLLQARSPQRNPNSLLG
jgi:hypothetical protein